MNTDTLVEKAMECLERKDFSRAKGYLKKACVQSPLRTDLREMLVFAIDQDNLESPSGKKIATAFSPNRKKKRSLRLVFATASTMICLLSLAALVYFGLQDQSVLNNSLPEIPELQSENLVTEQDLADPLQKEQEQMLEKVQDFADQGKNEEALNLIDQLIEMQPANISELFLLQGQYHYAIAKEAYRADKRKLASKHFAQAIESDPENAEYHFWQGFLAYHESSSQSGTKKTASLYTAEKALKKAISLDPELLKALACLAQTRIRQGKSVQGAQYYRKIINIDPASREADRARKQLKSMGMAKGKS